jgi:HlyD family secretion protein
LIAAVALCVLLAACRNEVESALPYRAEAAAPHDIVVAVESAGVVEPIMLVEVKSKASGEILELPVETGQRVEEGELLAKIDQRVPRNAVSQAEAGLEVARAKLANSQAQLRRIQKLFANASISEVDRETAQLEVANSKAEVVRAEVALENARIAMDDTIVTAPIAGTIIERLVERGQVISSPGQDVGGGTLLMRMADLTRVRVRALVDETDIGKVAPGMPAKVTVASFANRTFEGRVLKIEPQATLVQNVTMFPVLVELDNSDGLLKPGMNADVSLDIASRLDVLAIPAAALRTLGDAGDAADLLGIDRGGVRRAIEMASGADPAEIESGGFDRAGLQELREKRQRGEVLTDAERAALAEARARSQMFRGGGGGGGGRRSVPQPTARPAPAVTTNTSVQAPPPPPGAEIVDPLGAARRRSALDSQFGGRFVVFVQTDDEIEPRFVETGITDLDYAEIVSGLRAGEHVLLLPSASLVHAQEGIRERILGRFSGPLGGRRS